MPEISPSGHPLGPLPRSSPAQLLMPRGRSRSRGSSGNALAGVPESLMALLLKLGDQGIAREAIESRERISDKEITSAEGISEREIEGEETVANIQVEGWIKLAEVRGGILRRAEQGKRFSDSQEALMASLYGPMEGDATDPDFYRKVGRVREAPAIANKTAEFIFRKMVPETKESELAKQLVELEESLKSRAKSYEPGVQHGKGVGKKAFDLLDYVGPGEPSASASPSLAGMGGSSGIPGWMRAGSPALGGLPPVAPGDAWLRETFLPALEASGASREEVQLLDLTAFGNPGGEEALGELDFEGSPWGKAWTASGKGPGTQHLRTALRTMASTAIGRLNDPNLSLSPDQRTRLQSIAGFASKSDKDLSVLPHGNMQEEVGAMLKVVQSFTGRDPSKPDDAINYKNFESFISFLMQDPDLRQHVATGMATRLKKEWGMDLPPDGVVITGILDQLGDGLFEGNLSEESAEALMINQGHMAVTNQANLQVEVNKYIRDFHDPRVNRSSYMRRRMRGFLESSVAYAEMKAVAAQADDPAMMKAAAQGLSALQAEGAGIDRLMRNDPDGRYDEWQAANDVNTRLPLQTAQQWRTIMPRGDFTSQKGIADLTTLQNRILEKTRGSQPKEVGNTLARQYASRNNLTRRPAHLRAPSPESGPTPTLNTPKVTSVTQDGIVTTKYEHQGTPVGKPGPDPLQVEPQDGPPLMPSPSMDDLVRGGTP